MRYLMFVVGTLLFAQQAAALDLKGWQFTDSYRYSTLEDSYSERFKGTNVILGSYAYVRSPFYYTDENVNNLDDGIIHYNHVLTLGYTHYWSDALALGLDVAGIQNKVFDKTYTSFGDTNLRAKYLLTSRGSDWGLSLNPFVTLPTGKKDNFTTTRSLGVGGRVVLEKHFTRWHALGSAGYAHASRNEFQIVDQRNLVLAQLGLSYDINADWNVNAEMVRNFTVAADERQDEGDYFVTLKNKTTEKLALYGGAGIAGTQEVERNNYTLFIGFKWNDAVAPAAQVAQAPAVGPKVLHIRAKPKNREEEAGLGKMVGMENVYFENNSTTVSRAERKKIMKVVENYRRLGDKFAMVVLEGYASTRGNSAANEKLGLGRTEQVMKVLTDEGVPFEKISMVSYGDRMPQDPAEWKNRKVQFRIYQEN